MTTIQPEFELTSVALVKKSVLGFVLIRFCIFNTYYKNIGLKALDFYAYVTLSTNFTLLI